MSKANILVAFLSTVIFSIAGCQTSPIVGSGVTGEELAGAIGRISFQRNLAEQYVSLALARSRGDQELTRTIQEKYGHAAALGNSFIDKLKFSLTLRKIDSDELSRDVNQVAAAVNELYVYVRPPRATGGLMALGIEDLLKPADIESATKAAITVWKAAQERGDKIIEDLKKELDHQRWKSWQELPPVV